MRNRDRSSDELWRRFREEGDQDAFKGLMEIYYGVVVTIAKRMKASLPGYIELDDLISDGSVGLADAIHRYDDSQGYKFETYASVRIRGEILDSLRKADWAPRTLRADIRKIDRAKVALTTELQATPTLSDIAKYLEMSEEDVSNRMAASQEISISSIEEIHNDELALSLADMLKSPDDVEFEVGWDDLFQGVLEAASKLPDQDQLILKMFYGIGLSLQEIAEVLHLTEARASQLQVKALRALYRKCAVG